MTARRRYLVTYDVAHDRRRDRTHRILLDFGDWVQFSVFLCELDERERVRLRGRLDEVIDHRADQILSLDLGPADRDLDLVVSSLGRDFATPARVVVV
jgi:CRISPR-associated protein Cas2